MKHREIVKTVRGFRTVDGAGVSLVRVLGNRDVYDFDPFLMRLNRRITQQGFHGTRIAELKPSPTSSVEKSSTWTALATREPSNPARANG